MNLDKTIVIEVKSGCVQDVRNLPEGYTYLNIDRDAEEAGDVDYTEFDEAEKNLQINGKIIEFEIPRD